MGCKIAVLSVLAFVIYLFIGSGIFWSIEHEIELQNKKMVNDTYYELISLATCINRSILDKMLDYAWNLPPHFNPNGNSTDLQWDFSGSMFFSFVVLSTIGFGNQTPTTILGQVSSILYALFGIPLYMNVVAHLSSGAKHLILKLESYLPPTIKKYNLIIGCVFAGLIFIIIFLIPAQIFQKIEQWSFHEALYFSFITLSTIGFGDYVAGNDKPSFYQFLLIVWMLLGLVYVTSLITYIQFLMEKFYTYISGPNVRYDVPSNRNRVKSVIVSKSEIDIQKK